MIYFNKINKGFAFLLLFFLSLLSIDASVKAQVNALSEDSSNKIAPGEFLPVSLKLVNFGTDKVVDVIVNYSILDSKQTEIYSNSETVAVETTASFVKRVQIPDDAPSGVYTFSVSIKYPYQESPAISKFTFTVEKKIGGIFQSSLILYMIILVAIILVVATFTYLLVRYSGNKKPVLYDYSDKPKDQMIYYEILSDIISDMRLRIGDDAIEIAKNIPDLEINEKNGMILGIKKEPAAIVALLISRYEALLGKKVSFQLRQVPRPNAR